MPDEPKPLLCCRSRSKKLVPQAQPCQMLSDSILVVALPTSNAEQAAVLTQVLVEPNVHMRHVMSLGRLGFKEWLDLC